MGLDVSSDSDPSLARFPDRRHWCRFARPDGGLNCDPLAFVGPSQANMDHLPDDSGLDPANPESDDGAHSMPQSDRQSLRNDILARARAVLSEKRNMKKERCQRSLIDLLKAIHQALSVPESAFIDHEDEEVRILSK